MSKQLPIGLSIVQQDYVLVKETKRNTENAFAEFSEDNKAYIVVAMGDEHFVRDIALGDSVIFKRSDDNVAVVQGSDTYIYVQVYTIVGKREEELRG